MKINKRKLKLLFYRLTFNKRKVKEYKARENQEKARQSRLLDIKKRKEAVLNVRLEQLKKLEKHRKNKHYDITCYVVTYNHEKTIKKCLDSILCQKTKYSYLIKVLDDDSTDKTIDILLKYAAKYPDRIEICLQPENTHGMHISAALRYINTEYWCMIDGDDWWCYKHKIEKMLDYMNANKNIVMCVHDIDYKYVNKTIRCVKDFQNISGSQIFNLKNIIHSHVSGRIYRNIFDFKRQYESVRKRDGVLNEMYAQAGDCYYMDKVMSVYNKNSGGVWNTLTPKQRQWSSMYRVYMTCKMFNHKYDDSLVVLLGQPQVKKYFAVGKRLGWKIYIRRMRKKYLQEVQTAVQNKLRSIEKGHEFFDRKDVKKLRTIKGV